MIIYENRLLFPVLACLYSKVLTNANSEETLRSIIRQFIAQFYTETIILLLSLER